MLGIEKLKQLIKAGLNIGQKTAKALDDKKLSFFEAIGLVPEVFVAISIAKTWNEVKQEIADLSTEEMIELETYVMAEFDIPNAKVKWFISHAVAQIVSLMALVDEFKHIHDPVAEETPTGGIETPPPPPNP